MSDFLKLKEEIHARSTKEKEEKAKQEQEKQNEENVGKSKSETKKAVPKREPKRKFPKANDTFVADIVAGRPVITHPIAKGGLRLRYGRGRTSGFSAAAVHPATLVVMDDFFAIGTQCKVERPGKAATLTMCDTIEGPIVRLKDGSVHRVNTQQKAQELKKEVESVLFLGDILFNYGDFSENGHKLTPAGYCPEWWSLELEKALADSQNLERPKDNSIPLIDYQQAQDLTKVNKDTLKNLIEKPLYNNPTFEEALALSQTLKIPLHPEFMDHWRLIDTNKLQSFFEYLKQGNLKTSNYQVESITIPFNKEDQTHNKAKSILEEVGIQHIVQSKTNSETQNQNEEPTITIQGDTAKSMCLLLNIKTQEDLNKLKLIPAKEGQWYEDVLDYLEQNQSQKIKLRDKSGTFVGARMGRPEKAKMRAMKGRPHMLFPVGEEGGRMKTIQAALEAKKIKSQFNKEWLLKLQDKFGPEIVNILNNNYDEYATAEIDINKIFKDLLKQLNTKIYPDLFKGVVKVSNKEKIPENIMKGFFRAKYDIAVNKDGTTRYDCTELPLTHFKPKEIGTDIKTLHKLGYTHDIKGEPLTNEDQICEIFVQDVILPQFDEIEEGCGTILVRVAKFVDEILVHLYGLEPFYKANTKEDLVGHLIIGLAPHISAGTVGRIIGFSNTQGLLCHPMLHAGFRRDCDGDEAAVLLLLDGLLNFSKKYLPSSRGSTMDAALVLTPNLNPAEVDDQVLGVDVMWRYPLELYEASLEMKAPWEVKWGPEEKKIVQLDHRLGTKLQYEDFGFTHDVDDFNFGVRCSAYKTLPSMREKLFGQMEIARKLRAVDMDQVARLVIQKHFLADIKGNFRKYSMQGFRCSNCNEKYRRPPVSGRCVSCTSPKSKILFTISQGSVVKYLEMSKELCDTYDFSPYLKQTIHILKQNVDIVFGKEPDKQVGLGEFF